MSMVKRQVPTLLSKIIERALQPPCSGDGLRPIYEKISHTKMILRFDYKHYKVKEHHPLQKRILVAQRIESKSIPSYLNQTEEQLLDELRPQLSKALKFYTKAQPDLDKELENKISKYYRPFCCPKGEGDSYEAYLHTN
jgi:hypothetical protein